MFTMLKFVRLSVENYRIPIFFCLDLFNFDNFIVFLIVHLKVIFFVY